MLGRAEGHARCLVVNATSTPVLWQMEKCPTVPCWCLTSKLLELVAGLPEGYMFVWNGEVSANLFEEIDKDGDGEVLLEEVTDLVE